jgi:hypothetical protein
VRTTNANSLLPCSSRLYWTELCFSSWRVLTHRVEDAELSAILETSFKTRLIEIMDQSQHSLADHGGEGAAYEFAQGLDSWEKERESQAFLRCCRIRDLAGFCLMALTPSFSLMRHLRSLFRRRDLC